MVQRGKCEFVITTNDFESATDIENLPLDLMVEECDKETQGTKITLSDLVHGLAFPNPEKCGSYCFKNMVEKKALI